MLGSFSASIVYYILSRLIETVESLVYDETTDILTRLGVRHRVEAVLLARERGYSLWEDEYARW